MPKVFFTPPPWAMEYKVVAWRSSILTAVPLFPPLDDNQASPSLKPSSYEPST